MPHVSASSPLGHLKFNADLTDKLTAAALSTPKGIATYWAGPFLPVIYVATNKAKQAILKEEHVGAINESPEKYLQWLTNQNNVMNNFLAFMSIHSPRYKFQRQFLLKYFHAGAKHRLAVINESAEDFLKNYSEKYATQPRSLREFVTLLVLHTSSDMLDFTQLGMDKLYLTNKEYHAAIDHVAQYGISEKGDPSLEKTLYNLFCEVLKNNFHSIYSGTSDNDLIQCIFASLYLTFPNKFEDFLQLPKETQHTVAMTFTAVALAGLVHSTVNTLDWALASLLKNKDKMKELEQLMLKNENAVALGNEAVFDKEGPLSAISEWVLHNVFMHPTFSHEFFINSKSTTATLPDESKITISDRGFIIINYGACNESNKEITSKPFSDVLSSESTTGRFVMDKRISSFGGSLINKENKHTRVCPGAKTSLYEQMIIIAQLMRYSFKAKNLKDISLDTDRDMHPLNSRVDKGEILLAQKKNHISPTNKSIITELSLFNSPYAAAFNACNSLNII